MLVALVSCLALWRGLTTPQVRGVLFWAVSAGFAIQALAAGDCLTRFAADRRGDATNRGTEPVARD